MKSMNLKSIQNKSSLKSGCEEIISDKKLSLVDPIWQNIDPNPDVRVLFTTFDEQFFGRSLASVEVRWSSRMTLCAGMCVYEGRGGLCSVRLSEPLLKFRPRSDLIETLLHEMIHAYLFITIKNRDRDGHGPQFQFHMKRINEIAQTKITIFHTFHDEVNNYKVHWWQCDGICARRPPFFGLVRRAMNRAPGPNDNWWSEHQTSCTGKFIKVKEPEHFNKKRKKLTKTTTKLSKDSSNLPLKALDIRNFCTEPPSTSPKPSNLEEFKPVDEVAKKLTISNRPSQLTVFSGPGWVLGGALSLQESRMRLCNNQLGNKRLQASNSTELNNSSKSITLLDPNSSSGETKFCELIDHNLLIDKPIHIEASHAVESLKMTKKSNNVANCPVCDKLIPLDSINAHLDNCLS